MPEMVINAFIVLSPGGAAPSSSIIFLSLFRTTGMGTRELTSE